MEEDLNDVGGHEDWLNIYDLIKSDKLTKKGLMNFIEGLLQGDYHVDSETGALFELEFNQSYSESEISLTEQIDILNNMEMNVDVANSLVSKLLEGDK